LPGANSNDFRERRRENPLEIEERRLDPMKTPQTGFHPTRRFTLIARNVEFAPFAGAVSQPQGSAQSGQSP
jgi:hypothetical protein